MTSKELKRLFRQAKKAKDAALLNLLHQYVSNPLFTFQPRPDQPELFDEQQSFLEDKFPGVAVALGGNTSGKTIAGAVKVAKFILNTPPPRPNCPFWCVGQSFELACGTMWAEKLAQYILPEHIKDVKYFRKSCNWAQAVILKKHANGNNWVIEFKSADQERRRFQGASVGGWWVDEQIDMAIIRELIVRCRDYNYPGSMLYTLTPLDPDHDLENIFNNQEKYPQFRFYRMNADCNDRIGKEFIRMMVEAELEERRETRLIGSFASFSGCIYRGFNPSVHVVEPFPIPHGWFHLRGLDLGFATAHPTACVWIARDGAGKYYVYNEYRAAERSIDEHVEAIKSVALPDEGMYIGPTYVDWGNAQVCHELAIKGLPTVPAKKDVKVGIAVIQRLLRQNRLFIFRTCEQLVAEMKSYAWHPKWDKPIKEGDDLVDSMRYCLSLEAAESAQDWNITVVKKRKAG